MSVRLGPVVAVQFQAPHHSCNVLAYARTVCGDGGPHVNSQWRGIVVCHKVVGGGYSPTFLNFDYLCRRCEQMEIGDFVRGKYGVEYTSGAGSVTA